MGRRRSWLLLSQLAIMAALVGMALADPRSQLALVVWCALAVAFASATQDIALDAFRIESADARHQGALAATYQTGYRLAMIWAGAGVLWLAARAEVAPAAATSRGCRAGCAVPAGGLDVGLPGHGGQHAGGRGHGAVHARAGARGAGPARKTPPNGCAARWWSRLPTF
jgi:hypothetical protein